MRTKTNGLNDFDKLFITVTLWIAVVSLFATSLTLPMLPDNVTIFYKPVDSDAEYFKKYNNLLIVLLSIIPATIILIAASLKKRNKLQHNFMSIMLFGMILSICFSGVTMYGIYKQFEVSGSIKTFDNNTLIALVASLVFSLFAAALPMIFHSRTFVAGEGKRSLRTTYVCKTLDRFWNVGAYGFLLIGIVCSFCPGAYAYIPLGVFIVFEVVFILVNAFNSMSHNIEIMIYDSLDK